MTSSENLNQTLIIAEAGVNHNGDLRLAEQLVDVAVAAGVDAVKFQTFKAAKLVTRSASKADYQVSNTGDAGSQFDMLKALPEALGLSSSTGTSTPTCTGPRGDTAVALMGSFFPLLGSAADEGAHC